MILNKQGEFTAERNSEATGTVQSLSILNGSIL